MIFTVTSSWLTALGFGLLTGLLFGAWAAYRILRFFSRRRPVARPIATNCRKIAANPPPIAEDVVSALVGLGCQPRIARAAVARVNSSDFDSCFRTALEAVTRKDARHERASRTGSGR